MAGGTSGIVPGARVQRAYLDAPLLGVVEEHEGALRVRRDDGRLEDPVGWYTVAEVVDFCTPTSAGDCDTLKYVVQGNPRLQPMGFRVPLPDGEPCVECPMKGQCHGPLTWCDVCGDVGADNCDDEDCDAHRYRVEDLNDGALGYVIVRRHPREVLFSDVPGQTVWLDRAEAVRAMEYFEQHGEFPPPSGDCDGDGGPGIPPLVACDFLAVAAMMPSAALDCDDRDEAERWCGGCGEERDDDGGCPTVGCDHGDGWDDDDDDDDEADEIPEFDEWG